MQAKKRLRTIIYCIRQNRRLRYRNTLPLLLYTHDGIHADPNRILSTVPAAESSLPISAHPRSCLGLLTSSSWLGLQDMLTQIYYKINWSTVVRLRLALEIFSSRYVVEMWALSVSAGSPIPSFPSPGSLSSRLFSVARSIPNPFPCALLLLRLPP